MVDGSRFIQIFQDKARGTVPIPSVNRWNAQTLEGGNYLLGYARSNRAMTHSNPK
ncbi:hypothetical protein CLOSTMETH_00815 [[Clostridium] methylpentosum DSM 5476]|uniref:Uncharacterized protein n=1 Tax=[Clostridium] methylpentosum DSM 5476 TaxID=537013 RepID=C0EAG0_9FIRM|nr:hypothetical protein CLOSTMETH_00815 [[Clostridium] methylpentosum DSM 5476]